MTTVRIAAGVLLIAALAAADAGAQVAKLYPVDEAARDPEFFAFRARLLVAVQKRDTEFVYGILSERIKNNFGGGGGIADFKKHWQPEDADSKLWSTLAEVLAFGGQFDESKSFWAPYWFAAEPSAGDDPFVYGVIVGRGVKVRREPSAASASLADLDFDVIKVKDWKQTPDSTEPASGRTWVAVELADGRAGFVASSYVRSRIGYRAGFAKRNGRWVLEFFAAGD